MSVANETKSALHHQSETSIVPLSLSACSRTEAPIWQCLQLMNKHKSYLMTRGRGGELAFSDFVHQSELFVTPSTHQAYS